MQDKDQKLIWESYQDQPGELDFEKLPVDELKRLSPEEAKLAIGMLNKIDIAIQKGTDRMYNDVERAQRNNISGRIKLLNNIISPPPPPPTEDELVDRRAKKQKERDAFMNRRRRLQPTKQQFREDGTFEKISQDIPGWVKSQSRYQFTANQPGDGDLPANLQRMIVMDYLEDDTLPSGEDIKDMIAHLISINDLKGPSDS
jgi:hypothetical protein